MNSELAANHDFYTSLPPYQISLVELYSNESSFTHLPENWLVLVADIKNSTVAVANNQHNQVNLAATGCIVSVLNSLKATKKNKVPYFFGGDGAAFLIPEAYKEQLLEVLKLQRNHVKKQWNLDLVVGHMALKDIYAEGAQIRLAKIQLNSFLQIPVVLGTGLKLAEELIKKEFSPFSNENLLPAMPDLKGLECRWDKIDPPQSNRSILCLLVYCRNELKQREVYFKVLQELKIIFGELEKRQPISTPKLRLNARFEKIKNEVLATTNNFSYRLLLKKVFETYVGKLYFKYSKAGRLYLRMTKDLSETMMLDGLINTIISGTEEQTKNLIDALNKLESAGELVYGLHITHSAIMSCYVQDRKTEHAHFVDATEGGYTKAAEMLKAKFVRN